MKLLDQALPEQAYQRYMEANTRLIPREFIQNHQIHFSLALRKLSFGADYKTDFAYLSKSSDDWNCVLIEIERPSAKFFKHSSNDFHPDFTKALQQINQWRAWLLKPENSESFSKNTIGMIKTPLGDNPIFFKYVLVYGRRGEYKSNEIRRSRIAAEERPDFKILTFDSLVEALESKHDLYVGVRKNEYIEIISDTFLDEKIFSWLSPEKIRITEKLKENARAFRHQWYHHNEKGLSMEAALKNIRTLPPQAQTAT